MSEDFCHKCCEIFLSILRLQLVKQMVFTTCLCLYSHNAVVVGPDEL